MESLKIAKIENKDQENHVRNLILSFKIMTLENIVIIKSEMVKSIFLEFLKASSLLKIYLRQSI